MARQAQLLFLIDGHAQLYRAYHTPAHANRRATDGTPTGAVYGFFLQLQKVITRFNPSELCCVFDPKGQTFREKMYAGYKAQRNPMPEELAKQIPIALALCEGYGFACAQVPEFEADDVLGTLAVQASQQDYQVVIVSQDKDLLQLVNERVRVYDPMKDLLYDEKEVENEKDLRPDQIVDWLGLMGDAADNIPGVSGVGPQTAVKLLKEHQTLDRVIAYYQEKYRGRADEIANFVKRHLAESAKPKEERETIKPPSGIKVVDAYLFAQAEQAFASRELARICLDAPIAFEPEAWQVRTPDREKLVPLLSSLDLRSFLKDLNREAGEDEAQALTASEQEAVRFEAQRNYRTIESDAQLEAFAKTLNQQKLFAFRLYGEGTRVRSSKLLGAAVSFNDHEATFIPLHGALLPERLSPDKALEIVKSVFEDDRIGKIGHGAQREINLLRCQGIALRNLVNDVYLASWLLNPSPRSRDLEQLAYDHLKIRKTNNLNGESLLEDPSACICEDADLIGQIARTMAAQLNEAGLTRLLLELETPLVKVLAEMEWTGIKVDPELLATMSRELRVQLEKQEEEIYRLAGARFNINSPKQLGEILFGKLGLESGGKTATGQQATGEEVLQALAKTHELPHLVLEYRQCSKLKNTYVDALPQMIDPATGRIHARFNQAGAETGRLSSNDPNLQNIPIRTELGRRIRGAFQPGAKGWMLLSADYSQIELRILAHYSQDEVLLRAFNAGHDIHRAVAARIFEVREEEVTREQRAQAKTVNFGVLYGQTSFGLAQTLGIPRKEAQTIIDRFFGEHPGVRKCLDEIIAGASEKGFVTTLLERRRFIPQLKIPSQRKLGERLAVNTVFQGSAADLIKKAMLDIYDALHAPKRHWDARLLLQIHDELLFETPADELDALTSTVKQCMENALTLRVPLLVDTCVGENWLQAKD